MANQTLSKNPFAEIAAFQKQTKALQMNVGTDKLPTILDVSPYFGAPTQTSTPALPKPGQGGIDPFKVAEFGGSLLQGTARTGAGVGLELTRFLPNVDNTPELAIDPASPKFIQSMQRFIFGAEPIESISTQIAKLPKRVEDVTGLDPSITSKFAPFAVLGMTALDFTTGGKGDDALRAIAKTDDVSKIIKVLTKSLGLQRSSADELASALVSVTDPKKVSDIVADYMNVASLKDLSQETTEQILRRQAARQIDGITGEILVEFDIAEAGRRIITDSGNVIVQKSTFPKWVPEELRSRKLFDKVSEHISNETVPTTAKVKRLYDVVQDQVRSRLTGPLADEFDLLQIAKTTPDETIQGAVKFDEITEALEEYSSFQVGRSLDIEAGTFLTDMQEKMAKGAKLSSAEAEGVTELVERAKIIRKARERGFITTIKESPRTTKDVADRVAGTYNPLSNEFISRQALDFISKGTDEAVAFVRATQKPTTFSNAVAVHLIDLFQQKGNYQMAIDIIEDLAPKATHYGQAIQILSLYNRLTPGGVIRWGQRVMDNANKARPLKKALKMTPQIADRLTNQARKIEGLKGREKIIETARLFDMVHSLVPPNILKKISTYQTMAQLLNPKTAIRNIVGNAGFMAVENVKDVAAASIDSVLAFVTGKRTKALPSLSKQFIGFKHGFAEGVEDALRGVDTSFIPTQFDIPKTDVFKGKIGQLAHKTLNIELRAVDRAFYKAAYDNSIAQQMKALARSKNISVPIQPKLFDELVTDNMKEVAHLDALYRTFQDDNALTHLFQGLKRTLNFGKDFGIGDIVLKYPRTPANLLARGIEYSPAGFLQTLYETVRPLAGREFRQREFVDAFSRALIGSVGLVGTGALMHRLGIITGKFEEDRDVRGLQQITGLGQYRINVDGLKRFVMSGFKPEAAKLQEGDRQFSFDWFQPLAIAVAIGANIDEGNGTEGQVSGIMSSLASGLDTLAEQPLVSGLTRVMKTQNFSDSVETFLRGVPSSFTPTLLSQVNQLIDNTQRETYDPSTLRYALNLAANRIPGLAQTLQPRLDVFGDELERYQGAGNNLFNVFFNPAFTSRFVTTPEAQMVIDLFNETGEKTQFPRAAGRTVSINGENVKLNPKQISSLQAYTGRVTKELFASFADDPNFAVLPADEKVGYLSKMLTHIGTAGKVVVLGHRPKKLSGEAQRIIELYR